MATITVTNVSSRSIYIRDLYSELEPGESIETSRSPADLSGMAGLMQAIADGNASLSVAYTAEELSSGLVLATGSVEADDMAPVVAGALLSPVVTLRKAFAAGGGGSPDDVTVYSVNTLPFKMRVVDAVLYVATPVGGSVVDVNTRPSGAGDNLASMSSAVAGRSPTTLGATVVAIPGALDGMFIRRSDNGVAGEIVITCRIES